MPANLPDKIWFTYKARIQAQIRLERLDRHSQLLLVWYAFLGAVISVVVIRYPNILGGNTDILASILAVALLGISLAVTSRDFRGRSIEMRRNYLDLQRLYEQINSGFIEEVEQLKQYHDLLSSAENHKSIDDKIARVLSANTLTSRMPSCWEYCEAYGYLIYRDIILLALYASPLIALLIGHHLK